MAVQRMKYGEKAGYLANNQFIIDLACKKLELSLEQLETIVGRYSRGQRKGELRGCLKWWKITEGGWCHGVGVVREVGMTLGYRIEDYNGNVLVGFRYDIKTALIEIKQTALTVLIKTEVKEPEPKQDIQFEYLPKIKITMDFSKSGNSEIEEFTYETQVEIVQFMCEHPLWFREILLGDNYTEENDKRVLTVSRI